MKFKHASWRKLYRVEEGAFARLPFTARAYAAMLLKLCDDAGRIDVGDKPLADVVAFRMGATRGDRRMMAQMFPLLFDEGYLVQRGRHVVIRNFVAAQRPWDGDETGAGASPSEPRTDHEAATTEQRPCNEPTTNAPRSDHDGATKDELSARKDTADDASARARARSLEKSSTDTETPHTPQPAAGAPPAPPVAALPGPARDEVREVFAHWQRVMDRPRAKLDAKRERVIRTALARHGLEDCLRAVDGCHASDFHMDRPGGGNERGKRFNDVTLILRDAQHVEDFLARAAPPAPPPAPSPDPAAYRPPRPLVRLFDLPTDRPSVDVDGVFADLPLLGGTHG